MNGVVSEDHKQRCIKHFYEKRVKYAICRQNTTEDKASLIWVDNKAVKCNASIVDEKYKYYLKIGGIVCIHKDIREDIFKLNQIYGSFITCEDQMGVQMLKHCVHYKSSGSTFTTYPFLLNSVIPRYHGLTPKIIISCVRIHDGIEMNANSRRWTRLPNSKIGFDELTEGKCLDKYLAEVKHNITTDRKRYLGIYVPRNTSLIMRGPTEFSLSTTNGNNGFEATLIQEGGLVVVEDCELYFTFHRINDRLTLDSIGISAVFNSYSNQFESRSARDMDIIQLSDHKNPIIVLSPLDNIEKEHSLPTLAFWTLTVTPIKEKTEINATNYKREVVLGIPSEAGFERIYDWDQGIRVVREKQNPSSGSPKPWNKFIHLGRSNKVADMREDCDDPYPEFTERVIRDVDFELPINEARDEVERRIAELQAVLDAL